MTAGNQADLNNIYCEYDEELVWANILPYLTSNQTTEETKAEEKQQEPPKDEGQKEETKDPEDIQPQGTQSSPITTHVAIQTASQINQVTGADANVDNIFPRALSQTVFKFKPGCNLHYLQVIWGQLDQLCLRRQRLIRLMALVNILNQTAADTQLLQKAFSRFRTVNRDLNQILGKIIKERKDHTTRMEKYLNSLNKVTML